jgi:predicted signal transduction protein with EAL and GGDEF domain/FixJ family two-component response regulator
MPSDKTLTVLVVDDDPGTRLLAGEALAAAGLEVIEASDGDHALQQLATTRPDLVLLDVHMPTLDGYAVCEVIRRLPRLATTPVLVMTASDDVESVERAFAAGATDFITKPLNLALLAHRVRYLMRAANAFLAADETARRLSHAQRLARVVHWRLVDGEIEWLGDGFAHDRLGVGATTDLLSLVHPDDRQRVESVIAAGTGHHIDYRLLLADGSERMVHQEAELVDDEQVGVVLSGATQDVTELRLAERRILRLAYFDELTGLPNRAFLARYVARSVADAERYEHAMAVLTIDLDLFQRVNDTFGHDAGDAILREAGRRINACIRAGDSLLRPVDGPTDPESWPSDSVAARVDGDQFVVVLGRIRRPDDAASVARRISEALAAAFVAAGTELFVSASIGIATSPDAGNDSGALLERASAALSQVKEGGRGGYQFFDQAIQLRAQRRAEVEHRLRSAVGRLAVGSSEFAVHYQPKVHPVSTAVLGVEALVRWTPPVQAAISPAEFIPIAEDSGLIVALGDWVLRSACRQAAMWHAGGLGHLRVAVNISARQFRETSFVATVASIIAETGVAPSALELEITEHLMMTDTERSKRVLDELKALGVRIALDDFGTGYSSLGYLSRFPIDTLKIDRSFVAGLGTDASCSAIASAIIALGRSLDMDIVAEGVETVVQQAFLADHGCTELQGFLFGRPRPAAELADALLVTLERAAARAAVRAV